MDTAAKNRQARELLLSRCATEADMRAFILDHMPDQQGHIPEQGSLQAQITRLIERAGADEVMEALKQQAAGDTTHAGPSACTPHHSLVAEPAPWPWFERQWRGMSGPAQQSIREFSDVYLGTPHQPSGFGGRGADKQRILDWLANPKSPPYYVLRAITGRGKSALLSRVVVAASEQPDLDIVFVPVSLRFKLTRLIDVLHALLGQLAALSNTKPILPVTLNEARAQLHYQLRQPVSAGRRRLVVIDGLDELGGWQFESGLFPQEPSPTTNVLLSFRKLGDEHDVHWRRRLGLGPRLVEEQDLQPLGRSDVLEALQNARLTPRINGREPLLAERLFTLSEGDPLVLGLLIDECHSAKGLSHLLEGREVDLKAGLSGCWDRMLKPTERNALSPDGSTPTWRLMALLSCARAPIPREDMMVLAELGSGEALDRALEPVHRWVLNTGSGSVFNHPGLREFVYDQKLGRPEQQKWHNRFVAWGERVIAELSSGKRSPSAVPPYLLEWLSTHLVDAAAPPENFLALLSSDWKRAWEHVLLGYYGLLQDVELAMSVFEAACRNALDAQPKQPARFLPALVRCILWRSSIHSYTTNLDLTLLAPLVEHSLLTPEQARLHLQRRFLTTGRQFAHSMDNGPTLREAMRFLYAYQPAEVVDLAVAMADGDEHWHQQDLLLDLIPILAREDEAATLMRVRSLRSCWLQIRCLLTLCADLPDRSADWRAQLQNEACGLIQKLPRPHGFLNMLPWALPRLSADNQEQLLPKALAEAQGILELSSKCHRLLELAKIVRGPEQQQQVYLDALDAAMRGDRSYEVDRCLDALDHFSTETARAVFQRLLAEGRHLSIFHWTLREPGSLEDRQARLAALLTEVDRARVRQAGLREAAAAWDESWKIEPLRNLSTLGAADDALAIVRKTKDPRKQRAGRVRLIDLLPLQEQIDLLGDELKQCGGYRARERIQQLLSLPAVPMESVRMILQHTVDPLARARGLIHLLGRADQDERTVLLADLEQVEREITNPPDRIELLGLLFDAYPTPDLLDELLNEAAAETARTSSSRVESEVIYRLARWLKAPYRSRVLMRLVELIEYAPEHMRGVELVQMLGIPELPRDLAQRALRCYRHTAHGHQLPQLLPYVDDPAERTELLKNELARTQSIGDAGACLIAAASLATSDVLCQEIVNAAKSLESPEGRFLALAELGRRLPVLSEIAKSEAVIVAVPLVDSPRITAYSYVLQHGSPRQVRELVDGSYAQIQLRIQRLEPILNRWQTLPREEIEVAFHDLKHDTQTVLTELRERLISIGGRLDKETAEQLIQKVPWFWIDVMTVLLPALSPTRKAAMLAITQQRIPDLPANVRLSAQAQLVEYLPQDRRSAAICEILSHPIQALHERLLWMLAPMLVGEHLPRIIEVVASAPQSFLMNIKAIVARVPSALQHDLALGLYKKLRAPETTQNNALLIQLLPYLEGPAVLDTVSRTDKTSFPQGLASLSAAIRQMDVDVLGKAFTSLQTASRNTRSSPHDPILAAIGTLAAELTRRDRKHRLEMFDYILHTLRERCTGRAQDLDTLASLAPWFKELGPPDVGDRLAEEVLEIMSVWR